jgi:spermidine synthase
VEIWLTENQTKNVRLSSRITETLFTGKSAFQEVVVAQSEQYGRMLVLDGVFQTSTYDEFIYHEMIAHIPLFVHPKPQRVLIIGGGDGGSAREVLRHDAVLSVEMVEIDGLVVEVSKKFLPTISKVLLEGHPKFTLKIEDGIKHIQESNGLYDVIIVDCSDPVGPGEGLFTPAFYQYVYAALKEDGLFVQQTESPFFHQELITYLYKEISNLFPITEIYTASIPLYPSGYHCFTIGSKKYDPKAVDTSKLQDIKTRYHNKDIQKSCFVLPTFVEELKK